MDLGARTFRPAMRTDHVTQSTGYAYEPASAADLAAVELVMEQIYPVEEERRTVQRFCGYSLTGRSDQKYFLALTDRRRGNNGKSTVLGLLDGALGSYAMHARKGELTVAALTVAALTVAALTVAVLAHACQSTYGCY